MPREPLVSRRRPHRQEARLAERPAPLPQPRRHRLRLVQRGLLRAGRLLRARRPLHRAAGRRQRARRRSTRPGSALQGRRLPDRHRAARRPRVLRRWTPRILRRRAAGVPDFQVFGEAFISTRSSSPAFVRDRGLPNVLDFPLQDALDAVRRRRDGRARDRDRLDDDDYFALPSGSRTRRRPSSATTTWAGPRSGSARQRGRVTPELLRRVLLAHDLLYLLRGAPVVFYGDEVGIIGRGGDKAARQDMFPTTGRGVAHRGARRRAADRQRLVVRRRGHPIGERLRALGALRDEHPRSRPGLEPSGSRQGRRARRQPLRRRRRGASTSRLQRRDSGGAGDRRRPRRRTRRGRRAARRGRRAQRRGRALAFTVPPLGAVLLRADAEPAAGARRARGRRRAGRPHRARLGAAQVAGDRAGRASPSPSAAGDRRLDAGSPPTTRRRTAPSSTRDASAATSASTSLRSRARSTAARPSRPSSPASSGERDAQDHPPRRVVALLVSLPSALASHTPPDGSVTSPARSSRSSAARRLAGRLRRDAPDLRRR